MYDEKGNLSLQETIERQSEEIRLKDQTIQESEEVNKEIQNRLQDMRSEFENENQTLRARVTALQEALGDKEQAVIKLQVNNTALQETIERQSEEIRLKDQTIQESEEVNKEIQNRLQDMRSESENENQFANNEILEHVADLNKQIAKIETQYDAIIERMQQRFGTVIDKQEEVIEFKDKTIQDLSDKIKALETQILLISPAREDVAIQTIDTDRKL